MSGTRSTANKNWKAAHVSGVASTFIIPLHGRTCTAETFGIDRHAFRNVYPFLVRIYNCTYTDIFINIKVYTTYIPFRFIQACNSISSVVADNMARCTRVNRGRSQTGLVWTLCLPSVDGNSNGNSKKGNEARCENANI